jgi:iron complex outermembrane receptor protein
MAELFISTNQSGLEIYPNPDLKPESGWSTEIGIKQGLKFGNWMGYLDVAAFLMQYNDMMEFAFGQWGGTNKPLSGLGFKSVNVGKTQISGIEISLSGQGKINDNVTINILAGYTYMNPISLSPDDPYAYQIQWGDTISEYTYNNSSSDSTVLKYRYQHIAKIDAEIVYKKLSIGTSLRYNDFMRNIDYIFTTELINNPSSIPGLPEDFDGIPGINAAREKFKEGDFIIDIRAGYQINKNIRLGVIINNLLNREYMSRPANMMPQRTFAMQLSMKI